MEVHEAPALEGALSAGSQQAEEIAQRGAELAAYQVPTLRSWDGPAAQQVEGGPPSGSRPEAEQSAETAAAVPEAVAAQLAAVASGLTHEQLKALFLAILTGGPHSAPQRGAPRERQPGGGSALAQIPEDELGSAFWIGEVDSRSQPQDGRTQLVLVAGPYPSLTDALHSLPADREVGAGQLVSYSTAPLSVNPGVKVKLAQRPGRNPAGGEDNRPASAELSGLVDAWKLLASGGPRRSRCSCCLFGSAICR